MKKLFAISPVAGFTVNVLIEPIADESETEIFTVKHVGTGLMLIDLSIFKEEWTDPQNGKKVPFFNFGRDSQGNLVMGEDIWFCMAAQDMGHDIWVDPSLQIGHLGEYIY